MQITKNAILLFHTKFKYELVKLLKEERRAITAVEGEFSPTMEYRDLKAAIGLHDYYSKHKKKYQKTLVWR